MESNLLEPMKKLCMEFFDLKKKIKELDDKKKELSSEATSLTKKILDHLENAGMRSFDTGIGAISIRENKSVKIEDKEKFFSYLKESGEFEDIISVNSRTLNSYYKEKEEQAKQENNLDFLSSGIAGLSEPKIFNTLSVRGIK